MSEYDSELKLVLTNAWVCKLIYLTHFTISYHLNTGKDSMLKE